MKNNDYLTLVLIIVMLAAVVTIGWQDSVIKYQRVVIKDQRIYMDAGCRGRYQGEGDE